MENKKLYAVMIRRAYIFEDTIMVSADSEGAAQEIALDHFDISELQEEQIEDQCFTIVRPASPHEKKVFISGNFHEQE